MTTEKRRGSLLKSAQNNRALDGGLDTPTGFMEKLSNGMYKKWQKRYELDNLTCSFDTINT